LLYTIHTVHEITDKDLITPVEMVGIIKIVRDCRASITPRSRLCGCPDKEGAAMTA
jgi:hypothetical protein